MYHHQPLYTTTTTTYYSIYHISTYGSKFVALADYVAVGHSEVSMREGDNIELLKVGCAGWWYVRSDTNAEGWTPAAYLESINRKSSRSSSRNQERLKFK
ncbi:hypothetical protein DOY81_011059 [Sarcophaga bullata]|nr:hypothetical protein DOY81_011059 [Sarcophaga bullata]